MITKLFSIETKNGRAMRTLLQGFLGAMITFAALYKIPEFTEFIRSLDTLTGSLVFSSGSAAIAAGISRLMPVISTIIELIKEKK